MGFCWNGLGWGSWMSRGGIWGGLLLFVGLLAMLAVAWLILRRNRRATASAIQVDPLEIARRRMAAGEITTGEFEEIRDRL